MFVQYLRKLKNFTEKHKKKKYFFILGVYDISPIQTLPLNNTKMNALYVELFHLKGHFSHQWCDSVMRICTILKNDPVDIRLDTVML